MQVKKYASSVRIINNQAALSFLASNYLYYEEEVEESVLNKANPPEHTSEVKCEDGIWRHLPC